MRKINRMISMLLAVIMVFCMLPVSVFAADICSCVNRCDSQHIMDSGCSVCTASGDPADCMGTPILQLNGGVERLSDNKAKIGLSAAVNETVEWKYYYLITANSSENPSAETIIANGKSGIYTDLMYLDIADLAEGEKYIHIVLHQEEQSRTTNVLCLTIPAFVKLTLTPSADGGDYDAATNTLTIACGGTVNFTLNMPGYVHCDSDDTIEATPLGDEPENATEWTVTLPATPNTYTFYYGLGGQEAWCTVVVVEDTHYTLTIDYSATLPDGIIVGSGIANETVVAPKGEVIDLSEYWPEELTYNLGGNTYYFNEFLENATGGNTVRSVTISDDLTVYAYWTTEKQITITFDPNGGSLPYEKVREECCNISNMNRDRRPTRSGHDFVGWSLENDGTADDGDIQLTEDCTLYAVWKVNSLSAPTNLRWDTSNGTVATWDAVDGATHYIVELSKKDVISLRLISHVISDTSFDFDLTSLLPGSYYFTVRATCDDIKSKSATSNDIIMTSGGTPILLNGSSERVDYIDGTAFVVGREDIADGSVSEVDMSGVSGSTNLVIDPSKIDSDADKVTVKFDGTQAEMNNDALQKILANLGNDENLKLSVKDVGAEVLPDSLTEQGPYGGSEAAIDKSIFKATGIENIEDRLKTLGLINGNTDSSVTEDEFEYLYHYLTTDELTALKNELNESAHFEHHQNAVNWLTKMIERDATMVDMSNGQLNISGILSKLEEIGYTGGDFTLGFLRQADLDMEHLEYIRGLMQQFVDDFDDSADELVLAWANEVIAQKEFEATCVQMNALLEEARSTQGSYTGLNDVKAAAKDMTTYELKVFLKKANAAKNTGSGTIPVLALGAIDSIIKVLNSELEARGTNNGINPIFIGAVDVNIGAVKVDGTTTPIAIKADRSDAVAWSTNIDSAWLEEKLAEMKNATGTNAAVRAYKVLENGTLEAKEIKVKQNADGTLILLSALSNGNSTYVFLLEPVKADVDDTSTTPEVPSSPQTGDNSHMWLWFGLMLASGFALAGTWIYGRKRGTN